MPSYCGRGEEQPERIRGEDVPNDKETLRTDISEFVRTVFVLLTHFGNESNGGEKHTMITIC